MAPRLSSDRLVGRAAELEQLSLGLAAALDGRPGLTLVAGTSGIGKTRLLDELAAGAAGVRVLRGECVALGDGELAFAPIAGALRPLARDGDPALDGLPAATRAALARLLPDLGPEDPGASRARLFDALLALLRAVAAPAGLLLVLEDLHWADSVTRDVLRFLASGLTDERLLVVGSFRDDEPAPALRTLLADVEHTRVMLAPLSRDELGEQVAAIAGDDADAELLARLWARAQGNPLFVEELLAVGGERLPETLREALLTRAERLSPDARELLGLLTIGGRVTHPLLTTVSGFDAGRLRVALREAVAASAIVVDGDRYALRHALLREALRSDLLPGEAADVHRRFADALEATGGAGPENLLAIANHRSGAGEPGAILRSSVAAGEAGRLRFAYEASARQFERALEVWDAVPDAADAAGMDRTELQIRTADALRRTDAPRQAAELLQVAADQVDERADPLRAARILEKLADRRFELGEVAAAEAAIARAHALLDPRPEPLVQRSTLLATEAQELERAGRWAEAIPVARAAIEAAARANDPDGSLRASRSLGFALACSGHGDAAVDAIRAGLAAAEGVGPPDVDGRVADALPVTRLLAREAVAVVTALLGRVEEARELLAEVQREERAVGHETAVLRRTIARFALVAGDVAAARDALAAPAVPSMGLAFVHDRLIRAAVAVAAGEDAAARDHLQRAASIVSLPERPPFTAWAAMARARLESRTGHVEAARAAIDGALAVLDAGSREPMFTAELSAAGAWVEADAPHPDAARAAAFAARAAAIAGDDAGTRGVSLGTTRRPVEAAHAALTRAVVDGGADAWAAAADAYESVGWVAAALEARLHWARVVLGSDRAAATASATAVRDRAGALGLVALASAAGTLIERGGAAPPAGDAPYDLTARELQVLALLAAGRRNREIGAELFMAEKTASVHVSRILAKLGVRSRTEAAAIALAEGLA